MFDAHIDSIISVQNEDEHSEYQKDSTIAAKLHKAQRAAKKMDKKQQKEPPTTTTEKTVVEKSDDEAEEAVEKEDASPKKKGGERQHPLSNPRIFWKIACHKVGNLLYIY
jgi:hypothetical protein